MVIWKFLCYCTNPHAYTCIHMFSLTLTQMAWLGFLNSYAATGNRTHDGSVAPIWGTLIENALQTELPQPLHDNLEVLIECRAIELLSSEGNPLYRRCSIDEKLKADVTEVPGILWRHCGWRWSTTPASSGLELVEMFLKKLACLSLRGQGSKALS